MRGQSRSSSSDLRAIFSYNQKAPLHLITSLPDVDTNRRAYGGHSLGALFGRILSGVDERIKASVLMAGAGSFTDVALLNMPDLTGGGLEKYKTIMLNEKLCL